MSDLQDAEVWKSVAGFDAYEVSDRGRVSRVIRDAHGNVIWRRILKGSMSKPGYRRVSLYQGGRVRYARVHTLVAETFIGPRPDGMMALHKDDCKANNRLENLYYGSPGDNLNDAIRNGHMPIGSRRRNAKLTEADVAEIKRLRGLGVKQAEIAAQFGVCATRISFIDRGINWRHVVSQHHPRKQPPGRPRVLSADDIPVIRRLRAEGFTLKAIGVRFGITKQSVRRIITRESWAHIG